MLGSEKQNKLLVSKSCKGYYSKCILAKTFVFRIKVTTGVKLTST